VLSIGDRGDAVAAVQQRLADLRYWLGPVDGIFGEKTHHAVVALQKVAGIERDGVVGRDTRAALEAGITPRAQSSSGRLIEIDLSHQVLLLVQDGAVVQVFDTSTGREGFRTPTGTFTIYKEVDGWHEAGWGRVWRPKYFYEPRELAIHAYKSVPAYPASHGCARLIESAANWLWDHGNVPQGSTVLIY
jgi:lipoprotein-anchoring transpeptidase ErfK/SrfK